MKNSLALSMKKYWLLYGMIGLAWVPYAHSIEALSFERTYEYHNKMISGILKNYVLDQEVKVSFLLERNSKALGTSLGENAKPDPIDVPGLYIPNRLGTFDSKKGTRPIWEQLPFFRREITIVKKSPDLASKEVELLKRILKEKLRLTDQDVIEVREARVSPAPPMAKKDFFKDLKNGFYQKMILQSGWAVGVVFLFSLFLIWRLFKLLANSLKGVGDSIERADFSIDSPAGLQPQQRHSRDGSIQSLSSSAEREVTPDRVQDVQVVYEQVHAIENKKPSELKYLLWKEFSQMNSQLGFLNWIEQSSTLSDEGKRIFRELLIENFGLNQKGRETHRAKPVSESELRRKLSVFLDKLAMTRFQQVHPLRESLVERYFPAYGEQFSKGFQNALTEKWVPYLYTAFPEETLGALDQALENPDGFDFNPVRVMSSLKKKGAVSEVEVKALTQFLDKELKSIAEQEKAGLDPQFFELCWKLSDSQLQEVELGADSSSLENLKAIPRLAWVDLSATGSFAKFLSQLTGPELRELESTLPNFNASLGALDDRTQLKIKDRFKKDQDKRVDWLLFRKKIEQHYVQNSTQSSETPKLTIEEAG